MLRRSSYCTYRHVAMATDCGILVRLGKNASLIEENDFMLKSTLHAMYLTFQKPKLHLGNLYQSLPTKFYKQLRKCTEAVGVQKAHNSDMTVIQLLCQLQAEFNFYKNILIQSKSVIL